MVIKSIKIFFKLATDVFPDPDVSAIQFAASSHASGTEIDALILQSIPGFSLANLLPSFVSFSHSSFNRFPSISKSLTDEVLTVWETSS